MRLSVELGAVSAHDDHRRTRRVATGLLFALSVVFVSTLFVDQPGGPVLLARAIAEAGMIGGLADWFAVEALFRRPLGLPIPHTALLPANKDRAARNVGKFVATHLLDPGTARARIVHMAPARHAALQLSHKHNARQLARYTVGALRIVTSSGDGRRARQAIAARLTEVIAAKASDQQLTTHVTHLLKSTTEQEFVGRILDFIRQAVDSNRAGMVTLLQERSRWWIPTLVDRQAATLLVDGVISLIDELAIADSKLRREFDAAMSRAIDQLAEDGTLTMAVTSGRSYLVESGAFSQLTDSLVNEAGERIAAGFRERPETIASELSILIRRIAKRIAADPKLCADIDAAIADVSGHLLEEFRPTIEAYVANVMIDWDTDELIRRVETEVGRDLQFIRINGAVLGGLIGGLLHVTQVVFA